jgi:glutathione S-transferase
MAITFYWGSGSPPSWRVMLALEHKGIPYESRLLSFDAGDHKKPEHLALNPRGKVPVIVDDGFALYESVAILEYLDARYPDSGAPLYPRDARGAATVRRMVQEADHYFNPAATRFVRQALKKPEERDAKEAAEARTALQGELARLGSGPEQFRAGALSAADFALYPHMAFLRRAEAKDPTQGIDMNAGLVGWMKRVESLPYFDRTVPPHWRAA